MNGQTRRSRRANRRPDIDLEARRYFVYSALSADGTPLYIGRSCNVAARLRAHYADANHRFDKAKAAKAVWLAEVRSIDMLGPFTWREAVKVEREQIELHQPVGNTALTVYARRSA